MWSGGGRAVVVVAPVLVEGGVCTGGGGADRHVKEHQSVNGYKRLETSAECSVCVHV